MLGATPDVEGVRFAIPAPGVDLLLVCVFEGGREVARLPLAHREGDVHHGHVPGLREGALYGLRADGAAIHKLLLDPWARALDRRFTLHTAMLDPAAESAPWMPKAIVTTPLPALMPKGLHGPQVIYELHVKGFTATHPDVPAEIRGTFAGLAHPAALAHLTRLGVTAVEIMPAAAWIAERHLPPNGNHWGYNPVAFLAPDPRLAPGGMREVRAAVQALQAAGIGVILDVVLNHSGEGDALGPILSMKGLGSGWYRTGPDHSGCGNTLALDQPWPLRLAMDAMRHWVEQAGVDGLRLDLATTLGRRQDGFDAHAPLLAAMRQDPVLRRASVVVEPWDCGPGGYRLGQFPPGWLEWNDRFRDDTRRFWRGDAGLLGPLATRLAGSADVFGTRADSLNFITAHDGFTLRDLVSFTHKRNEANGEDNRDGTDANHAWNCGEEGETTDATVLARRSQDQRALLATLLFSRGTPMLSMGDECGRTQHGNNNAYAQDNPTTWFDWADIDHALLEETRRLIAARLAHPELHSAAPLENAEWRRPGGAPMQETDWHHSRAVVVLLGGCALGVNGGDECTLSLPGWRPALATLPARSVTLFTRATPPRPDTELLPRLAQACGIAAEWHDISGRHHAVPRETLTALLAALGHEVSRDGLAALSGPPAWPTSLSGRVAVLPLDVRTGHLRIEREDGTTQDWVLAPGEGETERLTLPDGRPAARRRVTLPPLPVGRHVLRDEEGRACALTIPPEHAWRPWPDGTRAFGITAQLYGLRHAQEQGIGDFTALAEMARMAAREGAALLGFSPPHALFPNDRARASPYHPSDRRFLDPIFCDVPEAGHSGGSLVDHAAVWAAKRGAMWARFQAEPDPAGFAEFLAEGGDALARFCAFTEPAQPRFAGWMQWLADAQLAAAARAGAGLYRDLAVGAAPDGAEVADGAIPFLRGFSIGAPPDPYAAQGQVWGLPVPDHRGGTAGFTALLRANMRHAAALRIDHVAGLRRLFVVPEGAPGSAGTYLDQPFDALLAEVKLESHRARCRVIGEDLGTMPEGLGEALREADVLSYRVLWFGGGWPERAAACVATHDMAPLAGFWAGTDLDEQEQLGRLEPGARTAREAAKAAISLQPEMDDALAAAIHGQVAATASALMLVQAEDLAGETIGVNLPGTDRERPNWRRRLPLGADALAALPRARAILDAVRRERPHLPEAPATADVRADQGDAP